MNYMEKTQRRGAQRRTRQRRTRQRRTRKKRTRKRRTRQRRTRQRRKTHKKRSSKRKRLKGGASLERRNILNPYSIPEDNIYRVHKEWGAGPSVLLTGEHWDAFSQQISEKHLNSDGHVKVYLLFASLFGGTIFHPIIAFSKVGKIEQGDYTYQLMSDEGGEAYIKKLSGFKVQSESFLKWEKDDQEEDVLVSAGELNIRSLVYIGHFTQVRGTWELLQKLNNYADPGYEYSENDHFDRLYSLGNNNCQTFVKRIFADLKVLRDDKIFVSPVYRENKNLDMVDIDLTQFNKWVRGGAEWVGKLFSPVVSSSSSSSSSG